MIIRDLKKKDVEELSNFKKSSAKISFPDSDLNIEIFKRNLLKSNPEFIKIVEDNKIVVGYIWLGIKKVDVGKYGIIRNLFIKENYRGKGLALKLMKLAEEYFKNIGIKKIRLTITLTNEASMNLCKKLGYKEKRIILEKELD